MSIEDASFQPDPQAVIRFYEGDLFDTTTHIDYDPVSEIPELLARFKGPDQYHTLVEKSTATKVVAVTLAGALAVVAGAAINIANDNNDTSPQPSHADRVMAANVSATSPDALQVLSLCGAELQVEAVYKKDQEAHGVAVGEWSSLLSSAVLQKAAVIAETNADAYGISCISENTPTSLTSYVGPMAVTVYASDIAPTFDASTVCGEYLGQAMDQTPVTDKQRERIAFIQALRSDLITAAVTCE